MSVIIVFSFLPFMKVFLPFMQMFSPSMTFVENSGSTAVSASTAGQSRPLEEDDK